MTVVVAFAIALTAWRLWYGIKAIELEWLG